MGHPILKPIMPKFDGLIEELRQDISSLPASSVPQSSPLPVAEVSPDAAANTCRVCGHALNGKDSCGNCGMPAHSTDDGMQSKWASMWFMQQAQKAVETGDDQRERLWPIDELSAKKNPTAASLELGRPNLTDEEIQKLRANVDPDVTEEFLADVKRGPRRVLSILKAQFKVRASGR